MREPKFRAWDQKVGEMTYAPIVTSYSWYWNQEAYENDWSYKDDPKGKFLMEYVGAGKDICEGDIVKSDTLDKIGVVKYFNCPDNYTGPPSFQVVDKNDISIVDSFYGGWMEDFEVIGNIHENPELLEGK